MKVFYFRDVDGTEYRVDTVAALLAAATEPEDHPQCHRYDTVYSEEADILVMRCIWCGKMWPEGPGIVFGPSGYFFVENEKEGKDNV